MITGDWVALVEQAEDCNILLRALPILTGYSLRMTCSLDFLISDKLLLVILILSSFYKYLFSEAPNSLFASSCETTVRCVSIASRLICLI